MQNQQSLCCIASFSCAISMPQHRTHMMPSDACGGFFAMAGVGTIGLTAQDTFMLAISRKSKGHHLKELSRRVVRSDEKIDPSSWVPRPNGYSVRPRYPLYPTCFLDTLSNRRLLDRGTRYPAFHCPSGAVPHGGTLSTGFALEARASPVATCLRPVGANNGGWRGQSMGPLGGMAKPSEAWHAGLHHPAPALRPVLHSQAERLATPPATRHRTRRCFSPWLPWPRCLGGTVCLRT